MDHDQRSDDAIELGTASVETRGVLSPDYEETFGIPAAGLSDD